MNAELNDKTTNTQSRLTSELQEGDVIVVVGCGTFECPEFEKVILSNAPYAPQTKTYNKVRYTMTGCGDRVFENTMNPKAVHLVRRSNVWGRVR